MKTFLGFSYHLLTGSVLNLGELNLGARNGNWSRESRPYCDEFPPFVFGSVVAEVCYCSSAGVGGGRETHKPLFHAGSHFPSPVVPY